MPIVVVTHGMRSRLRARFWYTTAAPISDSTHAHSRSEPACPAQKAPRV